MPTAMGSHMPAGVIWVNVMVNDRQMDHRPGHGSGVASETIDRAARLLAAAATSPARVIIFGSSARGDRHADSDLDFLVIEREVTDPVQEALRLRRAVGDIGVPVDVIVLDEALAGRRAKVPGSMAYQALTYGRVVAES